MYKEKYFLYGQNNYLIKYLYGKKLKRTQTHHMRIRILLYLHGYIINYLLLKCKQSRE